MLLLVVRNFSLFLSVVQKLPIEKYKNLFLYQQLLFKK
jgi:hypothetical protein